MEIELKFLVHPSDLRQLLRHPLLLQHATSRQRKQQMASTYFDTPDLQLLRHQAALRVRHTRHAWIQTLKCSGDVLGALHSRHEWETPLSGPTPDPQALRQLVGKHESGGKLLRKPGLMQNLQPIFSTHVVRTLHTLRLPNGLEMECALDQGIIECGERQERICELELEHLGGDADLLSDFARQLLDTVPLRIGSRSKAERGYALYLPQQASAPAAALRLRPGMTAEQSFQEIARHCLAHIQRYEPGVVEQQDAEAVHQMRIGLRRLRSALQLFGDFVPEARHMAEEFRWFAEQLAAARDWDVLACGALVRAQEADGSMDFTALHDTAVKIAHDKRQAAAAVIATPRYAQLILQFADWTQTAAWRAHLDDKDRKKLAQPVRKLVHRVLREQHAKLLKRGAGLREADAQERHRIRIAAKKMRYASDFFQSLYHSRPRRRYTQALSALQEVLGEMQDAAVADGLLRELGASAGKLAAVAAYVRGSLRWQSEQQERKLRKRWRAFTPVALPVCK